MHVLAKAYQIGILFLSIHYYYQPANPSSPKLSKDREMEDAKRIKLTGRRTTQLDDIPDDLIQRIQSLLPVNEAARTGVLSKSWLQSWSTNPTLRFRHYIPCLGKQQKNYMHMVDQTLQRYFRHNIPITCFKLRIVIDDNELATFVNKWIRQLVSKSCLTEICLKLHINNESSEFQFQLCGEIFSHKNLHKVSLKINAKRLWSWTPITDTFAGVRELCLDTIDYHVNFQELLKSKFPFLESLTLKLRWWYRSEHTLDISCVSLKRLIIKTGYDERPLRVQVVAPKLLFFSYTCGTAIPSLLFATHVPDQIQLNFKFWRPVDVSFFLALSEILKLSTKFTIKMTTSWDDDIQKQFVIGIHNLRRQVPCPVTNIQQTSFGGEDDLWGRSEFPDSFFSSICKPSCDIKAIRSIIGPNLKDSRSVTFSSSICKPRSKIKAIRTITCDLI